MRRLPRGSDGVPHPRRTLEALTYPEPFATMDDRTDQSSMDLHKGNAGHCAAQHPGSPGSVELAMAAATDPWASSTSTPPFQHPSWIPMARCRARSASTAAWLPARGRGGQPGIGVWPWCDTECFSPPPGGAVALSLD